MRCDAMRCGAVRCGAPMHTDSWNMLPLHLSLTWPCPAHLSRHGEDRRLCRAAMPRTEQRIPTAFDRRFQESFLVGTARQRAIACQTCHRMRARR
jgi:hypothetical protein